MKSLPRLLLIGVPLLILSGCMVVEPVAYAPAYGTAEYVTNIGYYDAQPYSYTNSYVGYGLGSYGYWGSPGYYSGYYW